MRLLARTFFFFSSPWGVMLQWMCRRALRRHGARIASGGAYVEENGQVVRCARRSMPLPDDSKRTVLDKGLLSAG